MKKTITAIAITAFLVSSVPVLFAQMGERERMASTSPIKAKEVNREVKREINRETKGEMKKEMKKVDPVCLQNAVEKRETSLISALTTQHSAVIAAHMVRKDAIKEALLLPTKKEVNDARNLANKNFESAIKKARTEMKTTREAVWPAFRTEAKACGHIEMERATVMEMSL